MNQANPYLLRCANCRAKNRIPATRINDAPVCGKCKTPLNTEDLYRRGPMIINEANFEEKVLRSPLPVLLECWAPWCDACRQVAPIIDQLDREWKGRVRVGKLNIDQNQRLSSRFDIRSVPFILVFDGGRLKTGFPGGMPKEQLQYRMRPYLMAA